MSKNEIRLRRQKMTSRGTERYRNYGAILQRHEQEMRIRKILRAFTMFLIVLIIVVLIVIVVRVERKANKNSVPTGQTSSHGKREDLQIRKCNHATAQMLV